MSHQQFDDALFEQAIAFLQQHQAQHLAGQRHLLVQRCVAHLRQRHDISRRTAEDVALRAYGEVSSRGVHEYVDLDRTTAHMVTLRDPRTGLMRMLTVADLLQLIGPAQPPLRLVTTH